MDIENIAAKAAQVGSEYETSQAAIAERDAAEANLLEALIERIRPALRALSSRIQSRERTWWPDNASTATETDHFSERGLCVAGGGVKRDHPRANAGSYEGTDLWLLTEGRFAEVTYSGHWSRWQGAASAWEASLTSRTTAQIAHDYDVDEIVATISEALDKATGSREKTTTKARERAEQIRAVTTLLRK